MIEIYLPKDENKLKKSIFKKKHAILNVQIKLKKFQNLCQSYDRLKFVIASPEKIRKWSQRIDPYGKYIGEVIQPQTVHFRNKFPILGGLFCEQIFGPTRDWKCRCELYSGPKYITNKICNKCFIELADSRIRRYRTGYIEFIFPLAHYWYFQGVPNYLYYLSKFFIPTIKVNDIQTILYDIKVPEEDYYNEDNNHLSLYPFFFKKYGIETPLLYSYYNNSIEEKILQKKHLKSYCEKVMFFLERRKIETSTPQDQIKKKYSEIKTIKSNADFSLKILKEIHLPEVQHRYGAEIFQNMLQSMDPKKIMLVLKESIYSNIFVQKTKLYIKQFRILNSFFETKTNPSWIILDNILVLPPTLRPFIEIENGSLISSDLNELYRLLIYRNNCLIKIINSSNRGSFNKQYSTIEYQWLTKTSLSQMQCTLDALINNARLPKKYQTNNNDKPLRGLTEILEGKFGRFRFNLLGKRIDYSGRSVIIVNPQLKLNQCGLPYFISIELFKPLVIKELITRFLSSKMSNTTNILYANKIILENPIFIWRILEELMKYSSVLLNRAPTLHKFGVQAFNPLLILGQAVHLHPLVCTGFNADFDGDQMAIHLPISKTAQLEVKTIMRPSANILSSVNGDPILKPTQDIIIGCYYLTLMINPISDIFKCFFSNEKEALYALSQKKITLHTPILVRNLFSNFYFSYYNNELKLIKRSTYLPKFDEFISSEKIKIYKILKNNKNLSRIYFFTNLGIFFGKKKNKSIFEITDFFFETTAGRILFSNTIMNSIYFK